MTIIRLVSVCVVTLSVFSVWTDCISLN